MWNHKSISFFPGKILSVNSFQKLYFYISLYILQKSSFNFDEWLAWQVAKYFISQRRVNFCLFNQKILNRQYFEEKNSLEFSNKCFGNNSKI